MNELLFSSKSERVALENVLAYNQIKKCDDIITKYNTEILELRDEIDNILKAQNVTENYMDIISEYKNQLKGMETDSVRMKELNSKIKLNDDKINGFNLKIKEMESELESLKRIIFDSDDARVIVDTQNEIEVISKRLTDLYDLVETVSNENTTALIEIEFLKASNIDNDFTASEAVKVEISNELHRISSEFDEVINELELSVREDIEFCMKKITNREKEIAKFEDRRSNIIAEYPDAIDLNYVSSMNKLFDLFMELDLRVRDFDIIYDSDCECGEDCDCGCDCNIDEDEKALEKEDNIFDQVEETEEVEKEIQDADVNIETDMVKIESIEKPNLEFKEVNEAASLMEETKEDEVEDVVVDESNTFSTIGSVPYIFSEGESLESIAEKVYPSKDCWEAIYNYNKEEIDSYLTANGMSSDYDTVKTLASDKYLFAGIQLNIPTDSNYKG